MLIQEEYFRNIFNTVREAILILDENMRVLSANRSFFRIFRVDSANTIGSLFYDLGNGQWNIPYLRVLLEDILPKNDTVDDYEIEHNFESIGHKTMLLNACKIREKNNDPPIILLAIEDITERREIENGLEKSRKKLEITKIAEDEALEYAESIINTVKRPLIVLDQDLRVVSASRSFYDVFKVNPEETVGQLIYDLGNKQWDILKLRELLETVLPEKTTFDNYEVEHDFTAIGRRIMLLNARQIKRAFGKERIILLAIEDITERKRLEDLVAESEERYRRIFETATDGIVLLDKSDGTIINANPATQEMLGYSKEESTGKRLEDIGISIDTSDFPAMMQTLGKNAIINYEEVQVKTKSGPYIYADIYMVDRAKLAQCNIRDVSERKRAAESLKEEQTFIENALNSLKDIFFVFDLKGRFLRWNKTLAAVTGYIDGEINLMMVTDLFRKDEVERLSESIQEVVREGSTRIEAIGITKDGRQIPYELTAALLRDAHGKPIGISAVGRDVGERKQAEDALKNSEKEFHLLAESMPQIVWVTRPDGWNTYFNHQWMDYTGQTLEESYGNGWNKPFHPDDRKRAWDAWQNATKYGDTYSLECRLRRADGVYKWWLIRGVPVMDDHGAVLKWFGTCTDIDDMKRTADELKTSEERFRTAVENLTDVLFDWDTKEKLYWYGDIDGITGNSPGGFPRTFEGWITIIHPEDKDRVLAALEDQLKHKAPYVVEYRIRRRDGEWRWWSARGTVLRDDGGNPYKMVGSITDITERKLAEEEKLRLEAHLRQAQKMEAVGTLAGGIAHDFNNILNVIIGYGTMVMDTLDAGSPVREQMSEVLIAADRAANLTKWLLVFSRKQGVDVKPVDVNEVLLGLQKMLVRIIRESTALNFDLAERPLIVLADAGQIEQVIINLAANARDAMQDGGRLTISTGIEEVDDEYVAAYGYGKPGRYALITVADTGQGMDAETQSKIFEPFFTTKGIGEGTGLGLAISYGIIKQHGGYIKVYSEPGQGTVFKIYLPLSNEAVSGRKMTEAAVSVRGGNETVLVAEDDASLRKLTRIVLESFGYNVISSEDGEDAVRKFMENRERINLVLLDMIMPKKNGKEVSEAIRKVSPRIKILFASGYPMINIKPKELTEADFDFINKPVLPKDLLMKVREILDREEISGPGQ